MSNKSIEQYCKHCGGTDVQNGTQTNEMSVEKLFKPEAHVGVGTVNVGGSAGSIGKIDTVEYNFESNQCQTCLNTGVINNSIDSKPLELCTTSNQPIVIIPHLLYATLSFHRYTVQDVYDLVVRIKIRLKTVLNEWEKLGINPCKKNRLGFKTTLPLMDDTKLDCWVIIDQIKTKLAYRLVFGGKNVRCQ